MEIFIYIGIIAIVFIAYFVYIQKSINTFNPVNENKEDVDPNKEFTITELAEYDGIKKPKVYLAVKGTVFDVTKSEHYRQGGSYYCFAGKDCSIALSKMDLDDKWMNKYLEYKDKMNETEQKSLNDWYNYMNTRYTRVGIIKY